MDRVWRCQELEMDMWRVGHRRLANPMLSKVVRRHSSELTCPIETAPCALVDLDGIITKEDPPLCTDVALADAPPPFSEIYRFLLVELRVQKKLVWSTSTGSVPSGVPERNCCLWGK